MAGRILIAEDEERISSFLEKGLRAAGYSTTVARDGMSALVKALSGEIDLLILDIGLTIGETEVDLTAREFALAELFFSNPGQVLSREQILSHVWGYDYDPRSNVVDVYVGYLRKKLGADRITGIRGMGYRLETG
jgi:DNA-binding response OmpR family regulator